MAEKKRKLLASVAVAGGLAIGGVTGLVLGVPGISGAQTTTTVPDAPTTTVPDAGATTPDRPARGDGDGDRENCPEKDGAAAEGSSTGVRGGGGRV